MRHPFKNTVIIKALLLLQVLDSMYNLFKDNLEFRVFEALAIC